MVKLVGKDITMQVMTLKIKKTFVNLQRKKKREELNQQQ